MKILITGGAGFLGLHLANYFQTIGAAVTLVDIASFNTKDFKTKPNFITSDVRSKYQMDKALEGQDYVIHAAAGLPLWSRDDIISTNIQGTKNILSSALKNNVKRTIYISSTAVYGVPKKHPVYEKDPLVGVGPYGESKIKAESACLRMIRRGLNVTIIRPKTFVGTGRLGVFEILFDWIHDGRKIPVIGSGNNAYQLLDVDDLVIALAKILNSRSKNLNEAFNIGAERFGTVRTDLEAVFRHAHSSSRIFSTPAIPVKIVLKTLELFNLSPLYQWVYDTADKDSYVSIDKIKRTIKWKPKSSNAQALINAYDWYLKHYRQVKKLDTGVTHRVGWDQGALKFVKRFM